MRLECICVDNCLPCYWSGHHLPHVQIAVWPGMKLREIKDAISSELARGAVMGSDDDARLLSADMVAPAEEKRADQLTRAAYAAVRRIRPATNGQRTFFRDIEAAEDDDGADTVYAYFVFREV